jgi:hypothetical protein
MNPQDLKRASTNKLRNYCCSKCGGVLAQIFEGEDWKVICGTNHCEPLKVETMTARTIRINKEVLNREVNREVVKPKSLFPED